MQSPGGAQCSEIVLPSTNDSLTVTFFDTLSSDGEYGSGSPKFGGLSPQQPRKLINQLYVGSLLDAMSLRGSDADGQSEVAAATPGDTDAGPGMKKKKAPAVRLVVSCLAEVNKDLDTHLNREGIAHVYFFIDDSVEDRAKMRNCDELDVVLDAMGDVLLSQEDMELSLSQKETKSPSVDSSRGENSSHFASIPHNGTRQHAAPGSGAVLVHCEAGVQRSPAVIAMFLILRLGMTYNEAVQTVHDCRPQARLRLFDSQLRFAAHAGRHPRNRGFGESSVVSEASRANSIASFNASHQSIALSLPPARGGLPRVASGSSPFLHSLPSSSPPAANLQA